MIILYVKPLPVFVYMDYKSGSELPQAENTLENISLPSLGEGNNLNFVTSKSPGMDDNQTFCTISRLN